MKKPKRKKTGGRKNSYGEKTEVISCRCPKSRVTELDTMIKKFLESVKLKN